MYKTLVIGNLAHLHLFIINCILFQCILKSHGLYIQSHFTGGGLVQCEGPEPFTNGGSMLNRSNMMLDHYCFQGFKLIGSRRTLCKGGKWYGNRPICAKPGCTNLPDKPEHGDLQRIDEYRIGLYCSKGYDLFGNKYAYCDGSNWDRPLGGCRRASRRNDCRLSSSADAALKYASETF